MTPSIFRMPVLLAMIAASSLQLQADQMETRPACDSKTRGSFWPQAANTNPVSARAAAQTGELLMCTRQSNKYRWRGVTVHWTSLRKKGASPSVAEKSPASQPQRDIEPADNSAQLR